MPSFSSGCCLLLVQVAAHSWLGILLPGSPFLLDGQQLKLLDAAIFGAAGGGQQAAASPWEMQVAAFQLGRCRLLPFLEQLEVDSKLLEGWLVEDCGLVDMKCCSEAAR